MTARTGVARLALVLLALAAGGGLARAAEIHQAQVEARVPWQPRPVEGGDGVTHLAYELHVTNFYADTGPLRLRRLTVFAEPTGAVLASFAGAQVDGLRAAHPAAKDAVRGARIEGGKRVVLFLWVDLPKGAARPISLRHRLEFSNAKGEAQVADGVTTAVSDQSPVAIGPPLGVGRWLAVEGPGNHLSHHWGSLVAVDGRVTIPQRFAIDWFGLGADGRALRAGAGPANKTTDPDWVGFGADVLAVADGVVRDARDGVADGTPLAPQAQPDDLTARSVYGNFVVLEIAPGVFAHYAHLRDGSVKVKVGDRVRRGDVIASLGQTGNAGAPHLHFQVSNAATFEESEGLPYLIDSFTLLGSGKIDDALGPAGTSGAKLAPATARRQELPLDGALVGFR